MRYRRGIDVRAVCVDGAGCILLRPGDDGHALLPGGRVGHGEHPAAALQRWAGAQTSAVVEIGRALRVVTEIERGGQWRGAWVHRDTIVYAARVVPTDGVPLTGRWVATTAVPSASVTARALGLAMEQPRTDPLRTLPWSAVPGTTGRRRQRFAVYGHVTDPAGNILLALISDGFPGGGRWHLPGGGTDFGEPVEAGLAREIVEETGQHGEIGDLLRVSHRHDSGPRPRVRPPGSRVRTRRAIDWHAVRAIYAVRVPTPTNPRVIERDGSTSAAGWFPVERARELTLTEVARDALSADPLPAD